ncbi:MAG: His-Xaa-Ser system radical SAM maturase HxsC [Ancalomicrobiaceae bacterium]|nr:His-Xaa-Ser system radical SAM maturase HxsC [Ancalomicrobiaceae bacterium]
MIALQGYGIGLKEPARRGSRIFRLSTDDKRPGVLAKQECFLSKDGKFPPAFAAGLCLGDYVPATGYDHGIWALPEQLLYLGDGDIVRIGEIGEIRVLFRKNAPMNYFLLTERCNNLCLMCSQPPKNVLDDYLGDEVEEVIKLVPENTDAIGFTGGEPALLGGRFLDLIQLASSYLPNTDLHVLSNGRQFVDASAARRLGAIGHPRLVLGIPLYSPSPATHDYVVQSKGAFNETVAGLYNLKEAGVRIELRVVVHRQNFTQLTRLANFIFRNLTFVEHIAFMGLELTGYARANIDSLWIDPWNYRSVLSEAVLRLYDYGMNVSIYNLPSCLLEQPVRSFSRKSISDWKNEFVAECATCGARGECCGFFASAGMRQNSHITAL